MKTTLKIIMKNKTQPLFGNGVTRQLTMQSTVHEYRQHRLNAAEIRSMLRRYSLRHIATTLLVAIGFLAIQLQMIGQVASGVTFTRVQTGPIATDTAFTFSATWGDYDGDGYLDLFVGNGLGDANALYHNEGDGTFTRVTTGTIANTVGDSGGCVWGDYDNDGDIDLFVANYNLPCFLFRNDGDGTFTRVVNGAMGSNTANSNGAAWGDYDNDGLLDLIVANSLGQNEFLYHNDGDGTFSSILTGPVANSGMTSGAPLWADYDDDGDLDLYIGPAGNRQDSQSLFFHNEGEGAFVNVTVALLDNVTDICGDWGDYDNDGDLDLVGVSMTGATNVSVLVYQNEGSGTFSRLVMDELNPNEKIPYGGIWGDYDNDGWLDLYIETYAPMMATSSLLYRNNGNGTFTRVTEGDIVNTPTWSAGQAWGDYDNDGFLDLFQGNGFSDAQAANVLYHNDGNSNHWLSVECEGTTANHSGIGAKVHVQAVIGGVTRTLLRQVTCGGGYGASWLRVHFGLGDATMADVVRIEWPSGTAQELTNVAADQILHVTERPRLSVGSDGSLSWPASADGFVLMQAESLAGPWMQSSNSIVVANRRATVTPDATNGMQLYRLEKP